MKRLVVSGLVAMLCATNSVAQEVRKVESRDVDSKIKLETVVSGYLADINGKYKLRLTEITFKPGGYGGEHHHVGPGIRVVTSGELTFVKPDKTTIYKAGDVYYESGDATHSAYNKGDVPVVLLNFEILPADWKGGSGVPPKSK